MLRVFMLRKDTNFNDSFSLDVFQKFRMFLFHIKTKLFPVNEGNLSSFDCRAKTIKCNKFRSFVSLKEFIVDISMLDFGSCFASEHGKWFGIQFLGIF